MRRKEVTEEDSIIGRKEKKIGGRKEGSYRK